MPAEGCCGQLDVASSRNDVPVTHKPEWCSRGLVVPSFECAREYELSY